MDISAEKNPLVNIVIKRFYGDSQLRMVSNNHVRRLSLCYKRGNDIIEPVKFFFCKVDSFPGRYKKFFVMTMGCFGIVIIFCLYGAHMPRFAAAIADVRGLFCLVTVFTLKTAADAVAAMAGTAQSVTDNQFAAGILFPASVSVDTEVVGIIKASVVPCVTSAVVPNLM